jgi:hypothetical protein
VAKSGVRYTRICTGLGALPSHKGQEERGGIKRRQSTVEDHLFKKYLVVYNYIEF